MRSRVTNVTAMTESAEEERQGRLRQYLLTMAIRTTCFILMIWVRGWWLLVPALGAIFLPMIAVLIANHVRARRQVAVESPDSTALVIRGTPVTAQDWSRATTAPGSEAK